MKITKTNGSYKAVLPKAIVESLDWGKGEKIKVKQSGKKMILEVTHD
jgi:antitoxin component of MazEF toxin-antitoxin module